MRDNLTIQTEEVPACLLCGSPGRQLYASLRDRLFGASGEWDYSKCLECKLIWLSPRPIAEEINKIYNSYYTHPGHQRRTRLASIRAKLKRSICSTLPGCESLAEGPIWRRVGQGLSRIPLVRDRVALPIVHLSNKERGTLLDVGCGSGDFLWLMRMAGWQVFGVEPDVEARSLARQQVGIEIYGGSLQDANFAGRFFDAIVINHVIEHVYDPITLLRECSRIAKLNGSIVIITPNSASLGYQTFKEAWIHLDPPRHLQIFSPDTLRSCCEKAGVTVELLQTSARTASWVFSDSQSIEKDGILERGRNSKFTGYLRGLAFQIHEEKLRKKSGDVGEELVAVARPN